LNSNGSLRSRPAIGSEEHKRLFCRTFLDTTEEYDPAALPWPELDAGALARLRALPIWNHALQAETNAGAMVGGFGATIADPMVREAVLLQGREEERHGRMIATIVERYGLGAKPGPPALPPTAAAFIHFGYRECLDSFVGFGAFRLARETEFMPEALISLFSRVLWEEARHIVFFVNWIAYERVRRGYGGAFFQAIGTAIGYVHALFDMAISGRQVGQAAASQEPGAPALSFDGFPVLRFLESALEENETLMARFDERLLRPRVVPVLAKAALEAANAGMQLRSTLQRAG
jgi:hypothetical protein